MPFNFEQWKENTKETLQGWKSRMERAGLNSAYYFLAGVSLLPVVQAVHSGDWGGLAVLGASLGSAVSTNLLANIVQRAKDKSEVQISEILETEAESTPELKPELDALLEKLDTLHEAEKALSTSDRVWFVEVIQRELRSLHSGIRYEAKVIGDGSIAQGNGAIALGKDARYIAGNYTENRYEAPDPAKVEADKNETARRLYLERMRRHCQVLQLAALGGEDDTGDEVTLDDVYIDLDISIYIKTADLEGLRAGKKVRLTESAIAKETPELLGRMQEQKDVQPLPLWDAIRATPRAVILGGPGAGKSTFARKLLGLQAAVLLKQCDPRPGYAADLLPVLIVLRELVLGLDWQKLEKLSAQSHKKELLAHIHQHLENDLKQTSAHASTQLIQQALEVGKVLLVLDGLDEVPQNLRKAVRQLVSALLSEYRVERLVITSRIRSYVGDAAFENLQTFTIREFDEEKIERFVKAWYNTQAHIGHVAERDREDRIQDLSRAAVSENLREISSNPMMLTSMAIIHQKEIGLPRERARLYKLVVDVLLRRWQRYKLGEKQLAPSPELATFLMDEIRLLSAMERLAYEAHLAGREKKEGADLPRMRALELLDSREYLNSLALAEEFLDYVDQRSGLLRGNGGELERPTSYSFPHRTFQEYLAGCYMVRERNPSREYYQRANEGDYWWLAAQLGAEELYYNRRAKHTVLDLAYQLFPNKLATEQDERASLWSAQVACIADLDEIRADTETPHGGQGYLAALPTRLLALFQSALSPLERAEAGRILAVLGDPRPEVTTIEKMVFCRVPAGEFTMGDGKEAHKVSLSEYFISQFPITNAQFESFVRAGGYKQAKYWQEAQKANYWSDEGFRGDHRNKSITTPVDHGAPFNLSNHPMIGLSWYEALAFTRWLEEQLRSLGGFTILGDLEPMQFRPGLYICLPSEAEWEKAARGTDGRMYPWGEEFNSDFSNVDETGIKTPSALGCFPKGRTPYGAMDMSGNVWEWTRSEREYPYSNNDRENISKRGEYRVLRGGSFCDRAEKVCCTFRIWHSPLIRQSLHGFRVVVSSPSEA